MFSWIKKTFFETSTRARFFARSLNAFIPHINLSALFPSALFFKSLINRSGEARRGVVDVIHVHEVT
jgi:hypothetical protein